jgi:hypothetical protein
MDITAVKDWLVPVSGSFALVVSALGARIALKELGLKLAAEARLRYSSQVEADIQLLKVFTEIMALAHGRGPDHVSERAIEFLLKDKTLAEVAQDGRKLSDVIRDTAILSLPVGSAAQDAAIAAIATLGRRHEILRDAAIQALESLSTFKKDVAAKQLARLR